MNGISHPLMDEMIAVNQAEEAHKFKCRICGNGWTFRPDGTPSGHSSTRVDKSLPTKCEEGDQIRARGKRIWNAYLERDKLAHTLPGMGYWEYGEGPNDAPQWHEEYSKEAAFNEVIAHVGSMTVVELCSVLAYMKAADYGIGWMGYAGCRICGETLGTKCMVTPDLKWKFPEKWEHYIEKHGIRPFPEQFIQDAIAWAGPLG